MLWFKVKAIPVNGLACNISSVLFLLLWPTNLVGNNLREDGLVWAYSLRRDNIHHGRENMTVKMWGIWSHCFRRWEAESRREGGPGYKARRSTPPPMTHSSIKVLLHETFATFQNSASGTKCSNLWACGNISHLNHTILAQGIK